MTKSKKVNSGLARAKALTAERRKKISKKAVEAKRLKNYYLKPLTLESL